MSLDRRTFLKSSALAGGALGLGTLGAAAACARLLSLDEQQTTMALGIAASQPVGLREQFGFPGTPIRISLRTGKNPYADV